MNLLPRGLSGEKLYSSSTHFSVEWNVRKAENIFVNNHVKDQPMWSTRMTQKTPNWFSKEPPTVTDSATEKKKICADNHISIFSKVFPSLLEDSVTWEGRSKWEK